MTFKQTARFRNLVNDFVKFGKENRYIILSDGASACQRHKEFWSRACTPAELQQVCAKANQMLHAKVY